MYTGTLISDLIAAVERAEEVSRSRRNRTEELSADTVEPKIGVCWCRRSEAEQLPQALSLSPADGNLGLLFVVHPQLVRTLKPGNNLPDTVDIHQIRAVSPPE
jgi:hypothetical protein